jgi:hypothetical protein
MTEVALRARFASQQGEIESSGRTHCNWWPPSVINIMKNKYGVVSFKPGSRKQKTA